MSAEDATINPDGSTTFNENPPASDPGADAEGEGDSFFQEKAQEGLLLDAEGIDPAFYLLGATFIVIVIYFLFFRTKKEESEDDFFSELDGDKFNLKLPSEVDDYYEIKAKCEAAGWEPGQPVKDPKEQQASAPQRMLAQALMKRAIADIPMVQHIQKESSGMNKLYSQSMCSVKQWRTYQQAESLVSQEVEDVRSEADEIEPGWSQSVWRQAMQYHQMLKQKHEAEEKAREEAIQKRAEIERNVAEARRLQNEYDTGVVEAREVKNKGDKEKAAEQAAAELLKQEEEEKKKGGEGSGMKKGFLQSKGKKK